MEFGSKEITTLQNYTFICIIALNNQESINEYFQQTQPTGSKVVACFDVKKLNKEEKLVLKIFY